MSRRRRGSKHARRGACCILDKRPRACRARQESRQSRRSCRSRDSDTRRRASSTSSSAQAWLATAGESTPRRVALTRLVLAARLMPDQAARSTGSSSPGGKPPLRLAQPPPQAVSSTLTPASQASPSHTRVAIIVRHEPARRSCRRSWRWWRGRPQRGPRSKLSSCRRCR